MKSKIIINLVVSCLLYFQAFTQNKLDQLFEQAVALKEASNFEEAIQVFDILDSLCQSETDHNNCFNVQHEKSYALMGIGDYEGALAAFRKGQVYSQERNAPAFVAKYLDGEATFLQMTGKEKESIPLYRKLISIEEYDGHYLAYLKIGNYLILNGKKDSAKVYSDTALMLAFENDHPDTAFQQTAISTSLLNLAHWESIFGSKRKAIEFYLQSLEYTLGDGSYMRQSTSYRNISILFTELKDFDKAEDYARKSIKIAREHDYKRNLAEGLLQLGAIYSFQNNKDEQLLPLYKEINGIAFNPDFSIKSKILRYKSAAGLGQAYLRLDSFDQAKKYFDLGLLHLPKNMLHLQSNYQKNLGDYYLKTGDVQQAIRHFEKAIEMAEDADMQNFFYVVHNDLATAYSKNGNHQKAYEQLLLFNEKKDSIYLKDQANLFFDLEAKYESELKDKKIIEEQLNSTHKTQQRNMLFFIATLLALLALVTYLIFRNKLGFQKRLALQKAEITDQKISDLEQKNKLLALSSVIEGQEEERLRVAKDLHDGIGGLLTTVKNHFLAIQKEMNQIQSLNLYQKTGTLIDEACVEVRRISHNMVPHSLTLSGLEGTLDDMAAHLNNTGINCTVETQGDLSTMSESQSVMTYRIIQELVNNVTKHADAKNLLIQILPVDNNWNILIEDDGKGFDFESTKEVSKSLGLKSIESRVKYLNGSIIFDSIQGTGTTVNVTIERLND